MPIAITRGISPRFADCALTHLPRTPIDIAAATTQHSQYVNTLCKLGCDIIALPPSEDVPDCVFVEDTVVVLDEIAVLTHPGVPNRRLELPVMRNAVETFRTVAQLEAPATLDGGDIIRVDRRIYVGQSSRTNEAGYQQLKAIAEPHGYDVRAVPVTGCLHLKTAGTFIGSNTVLLNPDWADAWYFNDHVILPVDPEEPMAGNAVHIDGELVYPAEFPRTLERLHNNGFSVTTVDASEIGKAEGGVTCCSVVFE